MLRNEFFHQAFLHFYSKLLFIIIPPSPRVVELSLYVCEMQDAASSEGREMGFNFFHHSHATSSRSPAERQRAQFMYDNDDEKLLYASFCSSYSLLTHSLIRICLLARHNIIVKFSSSSSNPSHHLFFSSILMYTFFSHFHFEFKAKMTTSILNSISPSTMTTKMIFLNR